LLGLAWPIGVGIGVVTDVGGVPPLLTRSILALVACVGLLLWRGRRLGIFVCVLAVAATVAPPQSRASPQLFDGGVWSLLGDVDGSPRRDAEGMTVHLSLIGAGTRLPDRAAAGTLRLRLPPPREPIGPTDRLLLRGRPSAPDRRCNFGACDGIWRAAADGIDGMAFVADRALVVRADRPRHGITAWLWTLREALRARIEARLPAPEAALVAALVVGERGAVGADEEARFRAAGVTHLLSVSGLHLAFAAGLLFGAVRLFLRWVAPGLGRRRPRDRWAAICALPIVVAYALLTGAEVATVRAALVVGYAFGGLLVGRRVRGGDALRFAALAILVPRPSALVDPSFQLSFAAAWATLQAGPFPRPSDESRVARMLRRGLQLVRVSFAATLITAPITAWHFSQIAPIGVFSNLVAVPLTEAAIVPLGLVGAALDLGVPALGGVVLLCVGAFAAALRAFIAATAHVSPVWVTPAPSVLVLVVSAGLLLWLARRPSARRLGAAAGVIALCLLGEGLWGALHPSLELTFVDIGQGDAAVIRAPDGRAVVVDGGGGGRSDVGARVLAPYLARIGVRRLSLVILTHPHPDHAGGLAEILLRYPTDELWTNGQEGNDPSVRALLAAAATRQVPHRPPRSLQLGAVTLDVLAPRNEHGVIAPDPLASENDNSLVVRLRYGGRAVLLTGDVEADAERALLRSRLGPVDVLKVPHHGSRTSSSEPLLSTLRPRWAIASLGAGNRYLFPHPDVVARYRAVGASFLRTDRDGAVRVRIGADGAIDVRCARVGAPCGRDE
jgi:competence protein ComEC